ncbi:MAG: hypothetical protein GX089_02045, partial [Fibrobacter sp.]|nr:hypothetical protein [Fibrobacter sp.]
MSSPLSRKAYLLYTGTVLLVSAALSFSKEVDTTQIPPTMTFNGTRGLTQTLSGEAL